MHAVGSNESAIRLLLRRPPTRAVWPDRRRLRAALTDDDGAKVVVADGNLDTERIAQRLRPVTGDVNDPIAVQLENEGISLEQVERSLIESALNKSGGSIKKASELLGITYKTLQYRIQKYQLQTPDRK